MCDSGTMFRSLECQWFGQLPFSEKRLAVEKIPENLLNDINSVLISGV